MFQIHLQNSNPHPHENFHSLQAPNHVVIPFSSASIYFKKSFTSTAATQQEEDEDEDIKIKIKTASQLHYKHLRTLVPSALHSTLQPQAQLDRRSPPYLTTHPISAHTISSQATWKPRIKQSIQQLRIKSKDER